MRRRHELTNAQWEQIRDLLPGKAGGPGRTASDNRLFVDAVIYVLKTGIPWEDLPARYGKPNSVGKRFDRWCASGVWGTDRSGVGRTGLGGGPTRFQHDQSSPGGFDGSSLASGKKDTADQRRC